MNVRERWLALSGRFAALQTRERTLVIVTLLVAILLLGWQFGIAPSLDRMRQAQAATRALLMEEGELESQLALLETELARDPNEALGQRRDRLRDSLRELESRLETLAGGLVGPESMVVLLREILNQHRDLTLVSVHHDPAVPVGSGKTDGETDGEGPRLYSHGVTLTVSGRYFDLVAYLQALEALDDRLGWTALRYEIQEWPIGKLELHLKTLSLSEEWLGV